MVSPPKLLQDSSHCGRKTSGLFSCVYLQLLMCNMCQFKQPSIKYGTLTHFQPSVVFYVETSHFICSAIRMTGFYM